MRSLPARADNNPALYYSPIYESSSMSKNWSANVKPARVLVVDDSALMRRMISDFVSAGQGLNVVGTARNGDEALQMCATLQPDVVTLDVQMPGKDGLATLTELLQAHPIPVVMVSSLTERGAETTLRALDIGAVDYVAKPDDLSERSHFQDDLVNKIRLAAGTNVRRLQQIRKTRSEVREREVNNPARKTAVTTFPPEYRDCCVAIGISTGGPPALTHLFQRLRTPTPPIVIVQHMPQNFTGPFAKRLDSISQLSVKEGATGDVLLPNHAFVAPGGRHMAVRRVGKQYVINIHDAAPVSGHRPSVDVMMTSVAESFGSKTLGVIMTGMGSDGVDGCAAIVRAGGYVLGQDQESSDVYGMNKAAFTSGFVHQQCSLDELHDMMPRQWQRIVRREPAREPQTCATPSR